MTDKTVVPLSAEMAEYGFQQTMFAPAAIFTDRDNVERVAYWDALSAIAEGRHGTYDKATHVVVEKGELELLRAAVEYDRADPDASWESPHPIFQLAADRDRLAAELEQCRAALIAGRRSLFTAMKSAWEGSTDEDVASHPVIREMDAALPHQGDEQA